MKTDIENNEWKELAPYLASLQKENPFSVPEQYFDKLSDQIKTSVYAAELKKVIPASGFFVPDQYFNSLKDRILAETAELPALPLQSGFSTPDLYFQKLQAKILARTVESEVNAETVALPVAGPAQDVAVEAPMRTTTKITRLWHSDLLKYASAACFILVSAFGFYLNQQNFQRETGAAEIANEQMLYDMDEQDIIDHIQSTTVNQHTVSDTELETYLLNNYSQNELSSAIN